MKNAIHCCNIINYEQGHSCFVLKQLERDTDLPQYRLNMQIINLFYTYIAI